MFLVEEAGETHHGWPGLETVGTLDVSSARPILGKSMGKDMGPQSSGSSSIRRPECRLSSSASGRIQVFGAACGKLTVVGLSSRCRSRVGVCVRCEARSASTLAKLQKLLQSPQTRKEKRQKKGRRSFSSDGSLGQVIAKRRVGGIRSSSKKAFVRLTFRIRRVERAGPTTGKAYEKSSVRTAERGDQAQGRAGPPKIGFPCFPAPSVGKKTGTAGGGG